VENDQATGRPGWGGGSAPSPRPALGPLGGRESKEELSFHGFRDAQGLWLHPRLHSAAPPGPEGITSARAICIPDGMAGRKAVDLSPKGFNSLAQGRAKRRPGLQAHITIQALKGRNIRCCKSLCRPYRAHFKKHPPPGALPWARLCEPFGLMESRLKALSTGHSILDVH